MAKSGDLLSQGFGNKPAEGAGATTTEPSKSTVTIPTNLNLNRGEDLFSVAGNKKPESTSNAAAPNQASAGSDPSPKTAASSMEDPSGATPENPNWSVESALKEVKKLREENKAYRVKYSEKLDELKTESETRIKQKEEEMKSLLQAKAELDRIKSEQEDKKRDLSEKVAYREAKIAEMQALMEAREKDWKSKVDQMNNIVQKYEADKEAEAAVYKSRLEEELSHIPDQYREYANLLVKGAGESRDALVALHEAKLKGIFEDKTIVVNHSVPGATDGARVSKDRLDEIERQRRSSMSSSQKIGEALKQLKSGGTNNAYRSR